MSLVLTGDALFEESIQGITHRVWPSILRRLYEDGWTAVCSHGKPEVAREHGNLIRKLLEDQKMTASRSNTIRQWGDGAMPSVDAIRKWVLHPPTKPTWYLKIKERFSASKYNEMAKWGDDLIALADGKMQCSAPQHNEGKPKDGAQFDFILPASVTPSAPQKKGMSAGAVAVGAVALLGGIIIYKRTRG